MGLCAATLIRKSLGNISLLRFIVVAIAGARGIGILANGMKDVWKYMAFEKSVDSNGQAPRHDHI